MATLIVTGYLPQQVIDNGHRSAREAKSFVRSTVKNAKGTLKKVEVFMGNIFITLKDDTGSKELKDQLGNVEGVKIDEPTHAELIFIRERARMEAEIASKNIVPTELKSE